MRLLWAALAFVLTATAARTAAAYPQFQLSTGAARCGQCHFNPAGGGLLTGQGRDALAETARSGDGALLHGLWDLPTWLSLGGDFRGAMGAIADGSDAAPEALAFPMQSDLYTQVRLGSVSGILALGLRGTARGGTTQILDRVGSREHYLMWRPASQGVFVRAGGFQVPYGLRLAEHPNYGRRFGGTNVEEIPLALSGGFSTPTHELHLTAFTRAPGRCTALGCAQAGGAILYERRVGESTAVGIQTRAATFSSQIGYRQAGAGVIGKHAFQRGPFMILGEFDYEARAFTDADYIGHQLLGEVALAWFAARGFVLTTTLDGYAEDLRVPKAVRAAASTTAQFFPWAHAEIVLYARATDRGSATALVILHYTL